MVSPIILFTDFGAADIYVGQVKSVLNDWAPSVPVIDLLHDAPNFNPRAAAHLLAALAPKQPAGSVFMAVVDPGVGSSRLPLAIQADGRWYVGPDNGLLSVVAARAKQMACHRIAWQPERLSHSFHGRDLFAPVAAGLASGKPPTACLEPLAGTAVDLGPGELDEVIYVDHYGNAMTGLRGASVARGSCLQVGAEMISYARVFSDVPVGTVFWHENSVGLVEIAVNCGNAAQQFNLKQGSRVSVLTPPCKT